MINDRKRLDLMIRSQLSEHGAFGRGSGITIDQMRSPHNSLLGDRPFSGEEDEQEDLDEADDALERKLADLAAMSFFDPDEEKASNLARQIAAYDDLSPNKKKTHEFYNMPPGVSPPRVPQGLHPTRVRSWMRRKKEQAWAEFHRKRARDARGGEAKKDERFTIVVDGEELDMKGGSTREDALYFIKNTLPEIRRMMGKPWQKAELREFETGRTHMVIRNREKTNESSSDVDTIIDGWAPSVKSLL